MVELPAPETWGTLPQELFDEMPDEGVLRPYEEVPWEELPSAIAKAARQMLVLAQADEDAAAETVAILYNIEPLQAGQPQLYGSWHVDNNVLGVSDVLPAEFLEGTVEEDGLDYLFNKTEVAGRPDTGEHVALDPDVWMGDTAAFANLLNRARCTDEELESIGLRIDRVGTREVFESGISVHRSPTNPTDHLLPRKSIAVIMRDLRNDEYTRLML